MIASAPIIADPAMTQLYALVDRLAPITIPVLITGETGCGKELVAIALHQRSHRADRRLISVNCATMQETLVDATLFGHEKGAFSGAVDTKPGLIEAADGSTLFLDEVGELALSHQAKLLRVLESQRVTRVGDIHEREVDVRIVTATNRDLEAEVRAGRFRQDLYYRLSAATLHLPPLRERLLELPLLARTFLDDACRLGGRDLMEITDDAMAVLLSHAWPGNVRELKNVMEYLAATTPVDRLFGAAVLQRLARPEAAIASPRASQQFRPLTEELRELEMLRVRQALEVTGGNQLGAARLIAMPPRTFFNKVRLYGLTPKKKSPS